MPVVRRVRGLSEMDCEWVLNDAISRFWDKLARGAVRDNPHGYFVVTCRRLALRAFEALRGSADPLEDHEQDPALRVLPDHEDGLARGERAADLDGCFAGLSDRERYVVTLVSDGLERDEIAEMLQVSRDNAYQIYCRAKKKLRDCLADKATQRARGTR